MYQNSILLKLLLLIILYFYTKSVLAQTYIEQWGLAEYHGWPILNDSTTLPGDASIGGDNRDGIASLRGSFGQDVTISKEKAIIVSGQLEFIGGSGGDDYMPIRYALTYQNNEGELLYAGTDSAQWSVNGGHYGYSFHPRTGTSTMSNGLGGEGTVWTIINGNWCSTFANNGWPVAAINQSPRNAELVAGVYDFAISVHVVDDRTNEIRWYMLEKNENYWFVGVVRDSAITTRFSGIEFGINGEEFARFNVIGMSVDLGDPLPDVYIGPSTNFIYEWGIIGDRFSGWTTTPGEYDGNFSISGEVPNIGMVALRGDFGQYLSPLSGSALIIKGELILEEGGFEASNSLRFGMFNNNDPGLHIIKPPDSMRWTGSEDKYFGYLFIPPSGANNPALWGNEEEPGNWGAVVNNVWYEPQADNNYAMGGAVQYPENAVAGEGTYEFQISFSLSDSGSREIRFKLSKEDESYGFAGFAVAKNKSYDTDSFNSISFALDSGNTTTALHLRDVEIDMGEHISLPEWITSVKWTENSTPTKFLLSQNYPNPFNLTTKIKYLIPKNSFISLNVFNILGQKVFTVFEGEKQAGNYITVFEGSGLSSGIYLYRLETEDFIATKKLVLLK